MHDVSSSYCVELMELNKEQILIDRLLLKEEAAWKELFEVYSGNLTYICSRYIIDRDNVHDVLQNGFIKMFRSIESFQYRGNGSLRAWMSRIVVNESLTFLKKNSDFKNCIDDSELPDMTVEEEPDLQHIPEALIMEMIRDLPEGYRTVFNLFVFEEKSHKEIAEIMGIAENSSASQFHRARAALAQKIREYKRLKNSAI